MRRAVVTGVLAAVVLTGGAGSGCAGAVRTGGTGAAEASAGRGVLGGREGRTRLLLVVVIDQWRGDEVERFGTLWRGGVARVLAEGRWYSNAWHGHARLETATGHATIATGVLPREHGVVDKSMWDRVGRRYRTVCDFGPPPCGAGALLVPTIGDRLKAREPGAKVVALSRKARAAALMGGREADLVAWIEAGPMRVVGRTGEAREAPGWLEDVFVRALSPGRAMTVWELPELPEPFAGWEDAREDERDPGHGVTFPHRLPRAPPGELVATPWLYTPDPDRVVVDMALEAAARLELGRDDVPDVLWVNLSAVDYVGHAFGPDSLERVAVLRSMDDELGRLLEGVEALVPEGLVVAVTSDHGVQPTLARAREAGHAAGRIRNQDLRARVEKALQARFGPGRWVDQVWPPYVTLTEREGRDRPEVQRAAAAALAEHPGIYGAWRGADLDDEEDPIAQLAAAGHHPTRGGDIVFVYEPHFTRSSAYYGEQGALHATPWPYDRHVPAFLKAPGIPPARDDTPISIHHFMNKGSGTYIFNR